MDFKVKGREFYWNRIFSFEAKPKIIGYLSKDGNGRCTSDISQIKYYIPLNEEKVHLDLNSGYDKVIEKNVMPSNNIDELLHWVKSHQKQVTRCRPEFISMRGVILALLYTLCNKREGWVIYAAKFKGIIYLCACRREKETEFDLSRTLLQKRMDSWGYKFEQYMLRDDPLKPPDTSKPVNGNEEFCCFFSNEFGYHSLLYAGEMDGFLSNETITEEFLLERDVKFVELKTGKLADGKSSYFFDLKLARAWCQSYLSCVEEVLYGFRTRNGIVTKIQRYTLNDIKEKTKKIFNPKAGKNFCNDFLDHIKRVVKEDYDKFIYKFSWDPKASTHIIGEKLENTNNQSEYSFLPDWYTK